MKQKPPNKWLILAQIPFQMGVTIWLFSWFGTWLDKKLENQTEAPNTTLFTLIGVFVALYTVYSSVQRLNQSKDS